MKKLLLFVLLSLSTIAYAQDICIEGSYKIVSIECLDLYRQADWAKIWYGVKLRFKTSENKEIIDMISDKNGQKMLYRFKYINGHYTLAGKYGTITSLGVRSGRGCTVYDGIIEIREQGKEPVWMLFKP